MVVLRFWAWEVPCCSETLV